MAPELGDAEKRSLLIRHGSMKIVFRTKELQHAQTWRSFRLHQAWGSLTIRRAVAKPEGNRMSVTPVIVGEFQVNCWILEHSSGGALVVDPGADAEAVLDAVRSRRLSMVGCLLTHGHMDHVSAVAEVVEELPSPVYLHPADASWAFRPENQWLPFYPPPRPLKEKMILPVGEGEFTVGPFEVRCLSTPGHTPGSVCYLVKEEKALFTGDTLFAGSIGRTDFPHSDEDAMRRSLRALATLDDNLTVYPGHGPRTSLGREKTTNMFLVSAFLSLRSRSSGPNR